MTTTNSFVPPPELVEQWSDIKPMENAVVQNWVKIATQAAQWGSDQELEACGRWLEDQLCMPPDARTRFSSPADVITQLNGSRRPKLPSLKEQALEALEALPTPAGQVTADRLDTIRRALDALDD
jgi:hypothetical protein